MSKSQIEMIEEIIDDMETNGHEVDFAVADVLDTLAALGLHLSPNVEINVAALELATIYRARGENDAGPSGG